MTSLMYKHAVPLLLAIACLSMVVLETIVLARLPASPPDRSCLLSNNAFNAIQGVIERESVLHAVPLAKFRTKVTYYPKLEEFKKENVLVRVVTAGKQLGERPCFVVDLSLRKPPPKGALGLYRALYVINAEDFQLVDAVFLE